MKRQRILTIVGTRPEAIKLAPVIRRLQEHPHVHHTLALSGQHAALAHGALRSFGLQHDVDLELMQENQSLSVLAARTLAAFEELYRARRPDWVLVQGDTTTAFAGALAAFYQQIRVAHVEAGLRTYNATNPFPEEINRRFIAQLAALHFAPTARAEKNLLREGISADRIFVTGNTGIDALHEMAQRAGPLPPAIARAQANGWRMLLVTAHRRESFGRPLARICAAVRSIVDGHRDVFAVYSLHPNPNVSGPVRELLGNTDRIFLVDAAGYDAFVPLMKASHVILTDSGGIQEEAPALGKPVIVLRATTERREGLASGGAIMGGTNPRRIAQTIQWLLENEHAYRRMARIRSPYGDGQAAARIVEILTGPHRTIGLPRSTFPLAHASPRAAGRTPRRDADSA